MSVRGTTRWLIVTVVTTCIYTGPSIAEEHTVRIGDGTPLSRSEESGTIWRRLRFSPVSLPETGVLNTAGPNEIIYHHYYQPQADGVSIGRPIEIRTRKGSFFLPSDDVYYPSWFNSKIESAYCIYRKRVSREERQRTGKGFKPGVHCLLESGLRGEFNQYAFALPTNKIREMEIQDIQPVPFSVTAQEPSVIFPLEHDTQIFFKEGENFERPHKFLGHGPLNVEKFARYIAFRDFDDKDLEFVVRSNPVLNRRTSRDRPIRRPLKGERIISVPISSIPTQISFAGATIELRSFDGEQISYLVSSRFDSYLKTHGVISPVQSQMLLLQYPLSYQPN